MKLIIKMPNGEEKTIQLGEAIIIDGLSLEFVHPYENVYMSRKGSGVMMDVAVSKNGGSMPHFKRRNTMNPIPTMLGFRYGVRETGKKNELFTLQLKK